MEKSLLERLEECAGPDRDLDFRIGEALDGWERKWSEDRADHRGGWYLRHADYSWTHHSCAELPAYTVSVDAVVALVEKRLPGWKWNLRTERHASFTESAAHAEVMDRDWPDPQAGYGICEDAHAATPAIALCIATLRALAPTPSMPSSPTPEK